MSDARYRIYIGYDSREDIAYQVCKQSILDTTKRKNDIEIIPLKLNELKEQGHYWREEDKLGSTEFTFSRFLVPHLADYKGWALFIDCDFVFRKGVENLFNHADDNYAVMCVHHDYTPKEGTKMDGQAQTMYPRKNWSSMVLWNCGHPANRLVNTDLINDPDTTGKYLHRFSWLSDNLIGEISHEWNWLVGWYKEPNDGSPLALHYTEGGPWFKEYERCEYAADWLLAEKSYNKHKPKKVKTIPDIFENLNQEKKDLLEAVLNYTVDPQGQFHTKNDWSTIKEKADKAMGEKIAAIDSLDENGGIDYRKKGLEYDAILECFIKGSNGIISSWDREKNSDNALVIRGVGGGQRKAIQHCWDNNRDFYAIDTGYFGNVKTKWVHRVTKNNLQQLGPIIERDNDRAKMFGYKYRKFTDGRKILICPPSQKVMDLFGQPDPQTWVKQTVETLRKYTDRPIEIRLKPNRTERVTNKTIQAALRDDVHCLITFNSIASVEALMEGKPAITLGPNVAGCITEKSLANVEKPLIPNKDEMNAFMNHIAYCQFTTQEMQSGYAWRTVNESSELPRWDPHQK